MKIESIGYYLPPASSLSEIIDQFPKSWQYPIHKKAGIENIRKVNFGEYSLSLSKEAVASCLQLSSYSVDEIDAIICCNICKYDSENELTIEPVTAVSVAQHFGIINAQCFDVNNACAGVFTGLYTAKSMIASGNIKRVLVVSGEYITKLGETVLKESQQASEYEMSDLLASLTLSDSAIAMIVEACEAGVGFADIQLKTYGAYSHLCTGYPTKRGPLMFTKSAELAQRATEYSASHTLDTLYQNAWQDETIRFLIPHQTAEKVIYKAIDHVNKNSDTVHFDLDNTLVNVKHRGNTSTTTHFVAMMDKILEGEINEGDKLVFSISASGITVGTALYVMDDLPGRIQNGTIGSSKRRKTYKKPAVKSSVSAVATLSKDYRGHRKTFQMIEPVVRNILKQFNPEEGKIGLIIFSGMYVTDHISEPAVAAMILKEIGLSKTEQVNYFSENVLAFDIKNGSLGTQNAIEAAQQIMNHNSIENALVIASEISQSPVNSLIDFPVETSASALLIAKNKTDQSFLLKDSQFYNFWNYIKDYKVFISWQKEVMGLQYKKCIVLYQKYLKCIETALDRYFESTGTTWSDYPAIAIPAISDQFRKYFFEYFPECPIEKVIAVKAKNDLFTGHIPVTLETWNKNHDQADKLLSIQVAAGIQVAIAVWEKQKK